MQHNRLFLSIAWVSLLVLFCVFSAVVATQVLNSADRAVLAAWQHITPRALDPFLSIISFLGTLEITLLVLLGVLLYYRVLAVRLVMLFLALHIPEILGKEFLPHQPLPASVSRYNLPFTAFSSLIHTASSYPSGHAVRAVFLVIIGLAVLAKTTRWGKLQKTIVRVLLLLFLVVLLYSRVSLGEHWPTDVIGGMLLGSAAACFAIAYNFI